MTKNYDKLEELLCAHPLETLDYGMIRFQYGTQRNNSIYEKGAGGRMYLKQFRYRTGVMTPIGDILHQVWYELAIVLINRNYDGWLLDALVDWYVTYGPQRYLAKHTQNMKKDEAHRSAIEGCVRRIYDNEDWVDYIPFNWMYRPRLVEGKPFLIILPECCNRKGQISEQIGHFNDRCYCPHCGRWMPAEIIGEGQFDSGLLPDRFTNDVKKENDAHG